MNTKLHWFYALNYACPAIIFDIQKQTEIKNKAMKKVNRNFKIFLTNKMRYQLIDDIKKLLLKSPKNYRNIDLFNELTDLGLIPGDGEDLISLSTFSGYVTIAKRLIDKKDISLNKRIIDLKKKDKFLSVRVIADKCDTNLRYVWQVLVAAGLMNGREKRRASDDITYINLM